MNLQNIFKISNNQEFEKIALKQFQFQARNVSVYKNFLDLLGVHLNEIDAINKIPFLPIDFFKSKKILVDHYKYNEIFTSSGTTGVVKSKHYVSNISIYENSYLKGFKHFYGEIDQYHILALLPNYLERKGSSLVYMVNDLIDKSNSEYSGFYLNNLGELAKTLKYLDQKNEKVLLIGVSFALLDLIESYSFSLKNTIVMETGGMKGRRKELIRKELHQILSKGFGVDKIHSEYGMTELLSQAYSKGNGLFETPPWMKVLIRDPEDALTNLTQGKTGGINIIDLANINSCSFIATQDLGKIHHDETFEIIGRFDNSDIRGCNLMVV